jgi:hypothetical protein
LEDHISSVLLDKIGRYMVCSEVQSLRRDSTNTIEKNVYTYPLSSVGAYISSNFNITAEAAGPLKK